MLLQNLHEPRNIQLGVKRQIMHVRNEIRNFLFENMEPFLERIVALVRLVTAPLVVAEIVVRALVLSERSIRITALLTLEVRRSA